MKSLKTISVVLIAFVAAGLLLQCGAPADLLGKVEERVAEASQQYSIAYDGNGYDGGTVPIDSTQYAAGETVTVVGAGSMSLSGNTFTGWNTQRLGGGTSYGVGDKFSMPAKDLVLFAQWTTNPTYTVTYDGNGSDSGTVPTDGNNYEEGDFVTVSGPGTMGLTGNSFTGWLVEGTAIVLNSGDTYEIGTSNVTLIAQWQINTYTLTYHKNYATGTVPVSENHNYDSDVLIASTDTLSRTVDSIDCSHRGWNTMPDGTGDFYLSGETFNMPDHDLTLYAILIPLGGTTPNGGWVVWDDKYCDGGNAEDVVLDYDTQTYSLELPNGYRYLATAPINSDYTSTFIYVGNNETPEWGGSDPLDLGVVDHRIGHGWDNTQKIVSELGSNGGTAYAAQVCNDLIIDGYGDYFLPSEEEMKYLSIVFSVWLSDQCWSSTQNYNGEEAVTIDLSDGTSSSAAKNSQGVYKIFPLLIF